MVVYSDVYAECFGHGTGLSDRPDEKYPSDSGSTIPPLMRPATRRSFFFLILMFISVPRHNGIHCRTEASQDHDTVSQSVIGGRS